MKEQELSQEEFYRELTNRFFHENSYFCHCIKNELDGVLHDTPAAGKPEYILLGSLIDHLVSANDAAGRLADINSTGAFQEFSDKLRQGISFLQTTDLDSERTKIEIESLAHSLFNSMLLAFQDSAARQHLGSVLNPQGLEEQHPELGGSPPEARPIASNWAGPSEADTELEFDLSDSTLDVGSSLADAASRETAENTGDEFRFDELLEAGLPQVDFEALADEVGESHTAQETERSGTAGIDCQPDEATATERTPAREADDQQVQMEPDVEVGPPAGNGFAQNEDEPGGASAERGRGCETGKEGTGEQSFSSFQPDVVISYFLEETREQLAELDEVLASLQGSPENMTAWRRSDAILDSLIMTAVVYGFEAFEQIAGKARKMIAQTLNGTGSEKGRALVMLVKSRQMLLRFMSGDPESVDAALVKDFTTRLQTPSLPPGASEEAAHETASTQPPAQESANTRSVSLESAPQGPESPTDEPEAIGGEETVSGQNARQAAPSEMQPLKLPGEDDQEVMSLIAEISGEQGPAPAIFNGSRDANFDNIQHNEFLAVKPAHGSPNIEPSGSDRTLAAYHRGAELYYSVIEEALDALETHKASKTALDDLDLAANALYGLALKLSLEKFDRFPDMILNLTKNALATDYSFAQAELEMVRQSFDYFRNMKYLDDVQSERFQQLLVSLVELSVGIKLKATSLGGEAVPSSDMPT